MIIGLIVIEIDRECYERKHEIPKNMLSLEMNLT